MIVNFIEYLKARSRMVGLFCCVGIAAIAIWSLTVDMEEAHTWVERHVPVFWGLFGFLACALIIFFARWYGKAGIKIREDYYDK
ncbi:MAG: hypothetical protein P4L42_14185 [Desulfocapsaceae bacterium]|nr:hypothetical protein [Desulfocapsaceae bacterium]